MQIESNFIIEAERCLSCQSVNRKLRYRKLSKLIGLEAQIFKCGDCGLVYSGSTLTDEGATKFYERKHSGSNYAEYAKFDAIKIGQFTSRYLKLERQLGHRPGSVLDLGCGEGQALEAAENLGWDITGVEISPAAVEKSRNKGFKNVFCSPLEQLDDLGIGSFDIISLFDVLDHVRRPVEVLTAARRHLSPNGLLHLDVCDISSIYSLLMGESYTHLVPFEHLTFFDPKTLRATLNRCGFEVLHLGGCPRPVSLDFLKMTLKTFNPILAKPVELLANILPNKLNSMALQIPVGIISATARLASV